MKKTKLIKQLAAAELSRKNAIKAAREFCIHLPRSKKEIISRKDRNFLRKLRDYPGDLVLTRYIKVLNYV